MAKFRTHFCMVSDQAAPNLLPLLDDGMKPEKVVLLVTDKMQQQANHLEQVIKPRGVKVVQQKLDVVDDFSGMQNQLMAMIENESATDIALNATGGTKWMAIAAQEVFRMNGSAVFYVKVEDDKVLFLDGDLPSHNLSQRIDLKSYVQAYGYDFRETNKAAGMPQNLRMLCESMVTKVEEWQGAIGNLNFLASMAEDKKTLLIPLNTIKYPDPQLNVLLNECELAGLLKGNSTQQVHFADEASLAWANGGWLEYYVNGRLNELKGEGVIQDSPRLNLHIQRIGASSHNEVDVCFMARNRLHLVECKTKRMSGKGTAEMAAETMYKLDSISDLGGLATKSMLVSYRKLRPEDERRAKDLRIKVVQGGQIQQLKSVLRNWISQ